MIDFLRANTWCTREEYMWEMSVAQVKLSSYDFSRVEYKKSKTHDKPKSGNVLLSDDAVNDLGVPIISEE